MIVPPALIADKTDISVRICGSLSSVFTQAEPFTSCAPVKTSTDLLDITNMSNGVQTYVQHTHTHTHTCCQGGEWFIRMRKLYNCVAC